MTKKGAIELSMTTIIVIVLGITLLILGFAFIQNIFGKLSGISDTTFDRAQSLLTGLESVEDFLTVSPTMVEVEQGKDTAVKIILANIKEEWGDISGVTLRTRSRNDPDLECLIFHDTASEDGLQTSPKPLPSGAQENYALLIKDNGGNLRTTACYVVAGGGPETGNTGTVTVRVVKPGGILG